MGFSLSSYLQWRNRGGEFEARRSRPGNDDGTHWAGAIEVAHHVEGAGHTQRGDLLVCTKDLGAIRDGASVQPAAFTLARSGGAVSDGLRCATVVFHYDGRSLCLVHLLQKLAGASVVMKNVSGLDQ